MRGSQMKTSHPLQSCIGVLVRQFLQLCTDSDSTLQKVDKQRDHVVKKGAHNDLTKTRLDSSRFLWQGRIDVLPLLTLLKIWQQILSPVTIGDKNVSSFSLQLQITLSYMAIPLIFWSSVNCKQPIARNFFVIATDL